MLRNAERHRKLKLLESRYFQRRVGRSRGTSSGYCKGYASCTAAVTAKNASLFKNTQVSNIWRNLNTAQGWTLGNTMLDTNQMSSIGMISSLGYGNYNALFLTWKARDYHGFSAISNFTWAGHWELAP
jgi:hypothetical protein